MILTHLIYSDGVSINFQFRDVSTIDSVLQVRRLHSFSHLLPIFKTRIIGKQYLNVSQIVNIVKGSHQYLEISPSTAIEMFRLGNLISVQKGVRDGIKIASMIFIIQ
jgi:hypothetical protein